ncbi:MAG TPA: DUF1508 domain-containing protein [Ignavibacteriaceae bacterium]|nr:DUF1508 domain-containing protein [Ignavibacteriaceae bacterium]
MHYSIFKDENEQWRWKLIASNGRSIAASGEGYLNKQDCLNAINLVKESSEAKINYN